MRIALAAVALSGCFSGEKYQQDTQVPDMVETQRVFEGEGPKNLIAFADDASITLFWDVVAGATTYALYFQEGEVLDDQSASRLTPVSPPFTHTGLMNGTKYIYAVTAIRADGTESNLSARASATPKPRIPPATPTGLMATGGNQNVSLTWNALPGLTYSLHFSAGDTLEFATATVIEPVTQPYLHAGLLPGTTYRYVIVAHNADGASPASSVAVAMTNVPPSPPNDVTANAGAFASPSVPISLAWTAVAGATGYRVYVQSTPGVGAGATTVDVTVAAHAIVANACAPYYFAVSALSAAGEGMRSAEIAARFCPGGCARPAGLEDAYLVDQATGNDATTDGKCFPFATIQAATAGRTNGQKIHVRPGTYTGEVQLPNGVTLIGDEQTPKNVVLDAEGGSFAIVANANSTLAGVRAINGVNWGISASDGSTIRNVEAINNGTGVYVGNPFVTIIGLRANSNIDGIYVDNSTGLSLRRSVLWNNDQTGINVWSTSSYLSVDLSGTGADANALICNDFGDIAARMTTGEVHINNDGTKMDAAPPSEQEVDWPGTPCPGGVDICRRKSAGDTGQLLFDVDPGFVDDTGPCPADLP